MISIFKILILALISINFYTPFIQAKPTEKVVLITNIESPKNYCCWARFCTLQNPDLIKDLDSIYRRRFKNMGYELESHHNPSQYKLFELLTSNHFKAIFFVSHSFEFEHRNQKGIINIERILNNNRIDIKPILKLMNTEYFSFCGCYSESHLPDIIKGYPEKSSINAVGFPGTIEAKRSLRESIKKFLNQDQANSSQTRKESDKSAKTKTIKITVQRVAPKTGKGLPVIQILANEELLTMLPRAEPGESQKVEFGINIPSKNYDLGLKKNANLLSIQVTNGYHSMDFTKPIPGEVEFFSSDLPGTWQLFKMASTGKPMGHNTNLYYYKDSE